MTAVGDKANEILDWVYEDDSQVTSRAADGLRQVNTLAKDATGAALIEVQDVGLVLARLADIPD